MPDILLVNRINEEDEYQNTDSVVLNTIDGGTATYVSEHLIQNQVQADWDETDDTSPAYIRNKPANFDSIETLPEVTPEDDGKILGVQDGAWQLVDASGGDALPEVTTDDEGKILQVVSGIWEVVEAPTSIPTASVTDNGKIMTVVDGVWAAETLVIPIELPSVTSSDDGKFLRVSGGVWVAEMIPSAEEAIF